MPPLPALSGASGAREEVLTDDYDINSLVAALGLEDRQYFERVTASAIGYAAPMNGTVLQH